MEEVRVSDPRLGKDGRGERTNSPSVYVRVTGATNALFHQGGSTQTVLLPVLNRSSVLGLIDTYPSFGPLQTLPPTTVKK